MVVLRDYQVRVLEQARELMKAGKKRIIIQAATGAGKGRIAGELARCAALRGTPTLILADRRRLISQLAGNLDDVGVRYGVIMSGETKRTRETVIVASRDTIKSWMDNPDLSVPEARLILVDEAHGSLGEVFQFILNKYPDAYVVGFTATPIRNDGRSLGEFWDGLVCAEKTSVLVSQGHLVRPEVYHPPELALKRSKGEKIKGLAGDPVAAWLRHAKDLPTIAFCKSVAESLELMQRFLDEGIAAEHIDATASDAEREAKYSRLKHGATKVLCSVKLLITGIDIPEVSCGLIWCRMGSLIEYLQSAGRIMRPVKDKDGNVLKERCVILDHSGAAFTHGVCPGDDIEWTLDEHSTAQQRIKKEYKEKDKKLITCPKCSLTFRGKSICPACGHKLGIVKDRTRAGAGSEGYEATDEVLVRLTADQVAQNRNEWFQREWMISINSAIKRGGRASMALMIFKTKTGGKLPWQCNVRPLPTGPGDWQLAAKDVFLLAGRKKHL